MKIKTKNTYIRNYMESDLYNLYFCMSKEELYRYIKNNPYKSLEEAKSELDKRLKSDSYLAITLLNGTYIGEIVINEISGGSYELYFIQDPIHWNNGYITNALIALTNYYIENKGAFSFVAYVNKENKKAINVLNNAGFNKTKESKSVEVFEL